MNLKFTLILLLLVCPSWSNAQENSPLYKSQKNSNFDWGNIDITKFLSLSAWKDQSEERALNPNWQKNFRERENKEIVGHFFQCVGQCRIDRGDSFFNPSFRSSIFEGDEIQTTGESFAWIFLLDGTMIRLATDSSVTINELNIGARENFINARINYGNVLWLSRKLDLYEEKNIRETDVLFNPLALYEAQPVPDRKPYKEDQLLGMVEEKMTHLNQYKNLNKLIEDNNKLIKEKPSYAFIVMPNATVSGYRPEIDAVCLIGGKTYLKNRSSKLLGLKTEKSDDEIKIQMRGFENKEMISLESDKWFSIDEKGKLISTEEEHSHWLSMGELITRNIPSLMVARELMIQKYSDVIFNEKIDPKELIATYGYRKWGVLKSEDGKKSDMQLHLEFIQEYSRRIETTNLVASSKFSDRLKSRGESMNIVEYGNSYFIKPLNKYYSYEDYSDDTEDGKILNSTTKNIWKRMHGIR